MTWFFDHVVQNYQSDQIEGYEFTHKAVVLQA